jgi:hypothetical protein
VELFVVMTLDSSFGDRGEPFVSGPDSPPGQINYNRVDLLVIPLLLRSSVCRIGHIYNEVFNLYESQIPGIFPSSRPQVTKLYYSDCSGPTTV